MAFPVIVKILAILWLTVSLFTRKLTGKKVWLTFFTSNGYNLSIFYALPLFFLLFHG